MKHKKILLILIAIYFAVFNFDLIHAQSSNNIIKVNYEASYVTPQMLSLLRKQTNSIEKYENVLNALKEERVYYSLFINTESNKSVFILDSIHENKNVSPTALIEYVYSEGTDILLGSEKFIKSEYNFSGSFKQLEWHITSEKKVINGYVCKKAISNKDKYISVWFTSKIALNNGPGYFQGIPGLVIEANDFFLSYKLLSISYDTDIEFDNLIKKSDSFKKKEDLNIDKVLLSKSNLINMILNKEKSTN